tara:strand:- start:7401 stop:7610 length:210 start_codon:yes stop_codon:yes gene_type:complete
MNVSEAQSIIDLHYDWGLITLNEKHKHSLAARYTSFNVDGSFDAYQHPRSAKSRARYMAEYFGAESITI